MVKQLTAKQREVLLGMLNESYRDAHAHTRIFEQGFSETPETHEIKAWFIKEHIVPAINKTLAKGEIEIDEEN